jgi:arylsulfatase A-like enzyme
MKFSNTHLVLFFLLLTMGNAYSSDGLKPKKENKNKKPNLIVIMCDDLGYSDVGFNGSTEIPTPNIDRIANQGVKFSSGYTSYSVCGPSRAGFITGRYQQRFGFERNPQYKPKDPNMGLPKNEQTIAESLKKVGYKSGIIGKWHLGADISNHPLNRGFDEFFGHLGGGHRYFPEELSIEDSYGVETEAESYRTYIMRNHKPVKTSKYLTDEFSDAAVDFVERNRKESFFLYLSYNAPHAPMQATEKYLNRFSHIKDNKRKTYAAMVSAVDDGVGQLLDKLEELNLDENTLVFFLSDNGGPETANASDNGPLRDGKGSNYEGGYRVPFAFMWKGKINKGVFHKPVTALDIFATISELSASPTLEDKSLDGVNLIPYLNGENKSRPHETIYLRKFDSKNSSIRKGDYKLVKKRGGAVKELYNLNEDIGEKNDLSENYPDKVNELEQLWEQWNSELIDPIFLGLIHTDSWKKKAKRNKSKKKSSKKNHSKNNANID